jgi:signal transduction histidine kinase
LGYAQILKKDDNFTKEQRKGLEIIEDSGKHLLELINDILDLSKIEARKFELDEREFELVPTIESVTNIIQVKTKEKKLEFINRYDTVMPKFVLGDPRALKQILLNLLGNAIKFTEAGSVSLISSFTGNKLKIDIIDTGIGIEKTDLKTIFNPFEQSGNKVKSIEGTGLGLAITEKLVNLMGGKITVESKIGVGSTFSIELSLTETIHTEDKEKTLLRIFQDIKERLKKFLLLMISKLI